jgi:ribosomal protein L7/L12
MTTPDIVIVVTVTATAFVTVINAVAAGWGRQAAKDRGERAEQKLDVIHDLTNSNMTALKQQLAATGLQLAAALDRIDKLETLLTQHGQG